MMPPTRAFQETVRARAQADPAFRVALLSEAADAFMQGDPATGRAVLRNYIT